MKRKVLISCVFLILVGCATTKIPEISGTDKNSGMVELAYDYGLFEAPKVQMDKVLASASRQCKAWGFQGAEQYGPEQKECKRQDQNGNCVLTHVSMAYLCNLSPEEKVARNAGFDSAVQHKFATSKGLTPKQTVKLKKLSVESSDQYDAATTEMVKNKYADDNAPDTIISFIQDKTESVKNGTSIKDERKKRIENEKYVGCYVIDDKYALWATGNKELNSCDPQTITSQITEEYATIHLWKFKNDHEIVRYTASSKPYLAVSSDVSSVSEYKRKGSLIEEMMANGCLSKEQIMEDNNEYIVLKEKYFGGSGCSKAKIAASQIGHTVKYKKINESN